MSALQNGLSLVRVQSHFFILYALVLCLVCGWAEFYRAFLYLNLLAVCFFYYQNRHIHHTAFKLTIAVPAVFTVLHCLAVGRIELVKDIRHLWLAAFVVLGVYCLSYKDMNWAKRYGDWLAVALLVVYSVAQGVGFIYLEQPFGIMGNPHYLGFYSVVCLFIGLSQMPRQWKFQHYLLLTGLLLMGFFILYSSSRPAWLALLVAGLFWFLCMPERKKVIYFIALIALMFASNIGDFASRLTELAVNITAEQRVAIWQETLAMLKDGTITSWLIGGGVESFEQAYALSNSRYREFDFPHNSIFEVVYISGIAGLLVFVGLYSLLFYRLHHLRKNILYSEGLTTLVMAATLFHCLTAFVNFPLLSPHNLYPLALLFGIYLYMNEKNHSEMIKVEGSGGEHGKLRASLMEAKA